MLEDWLKWITRLLRTEESMVPQRKLPQEQPGPHEVPDMSNPIPFRTAARGAGSVVPLHRRPPRSSKQARDAEWVNLQHVAPDVCIQRAYYLEARRGFATDSALAEAMGVNRSQVSRWAQGRAAHAENAWLLRDLATAVSRMADYYNPASIHRWLFGANPDMGGEPPMALLRQGRLPEVLMAIEAQTSGAFG
jgi:transcriptional regulator with XRE-family HTH domain